LEVPDLQVVQCHRGTLLFLLGKHTSSFRIKVVKFILPHPRGCAKSNHPHRYEGYQHHGLEYPLDGMVGTEPTEAYQSSVGEEQRASSYGNGIAQDMGSHTQYETPGGDLCW